MRLYFSVTLLLLLPIGNASGRDLTLEQSLQLAREHSYRLKQAQAEVRAAEETLGAARAERLPTLSASASATYLSNIPEVNLGIPGLAGLSRDFGSKDNYQTDVRLTLPLFTGGRIGSAVSQARSNRQYNQALEQAEVNRVLYQTRLDYLGLYRSLKLRDAASASLKRTEIVLSNVQSRYEAGVSDSVDLLEADLAHSQAQFATEQAAIDIRSSELQLLVSLGLVLSEKLNLTDTLPDPPTEPVLVGQLGLRPELQAAEAAVNINRALVSAEKAGYLPSLSVFGGYSYGKPNQDFFNNHWRDFWTFGGNLTWSFNLGFKTTSRQKAARFGVEAARHHQSDLTESINRDTELALERLKLSHRRYLNALKEYRISSNNFRLARAQHQSGALSTNRLLEIEAALSQTESTLAAAKVDYYIVQSGYFYAAGSDELRKGI